MPQTSSVIIPDVGEVFITKRRGQRSLRLRIDAKGQVQVSMPWFVPKLAAIDFVKGKRAWIAEQQIAHKFEPYDGMLVAKTLRLRIHEHSAKTRSRGEKGEISVHFANSYDATDPDHIKKIERVIIKALRVEAEKVLLPRLQELADLYGYSFKSSQIKKVTGRWGSCDSHKNIALSIYLVQLPIELIDYVMLHELAHTHHLNHSQAFWHEVTKYCPDYKLLRKRLRDIRPRLYDAKALMS